jgi:hypothetical protein
LKIIITKKELKRVLGNDIDVRIKNNKTDVKVRGFTNGILNKYNINSFYYSIENHTQRRFQSDDLSLLAHYKLLT